MDDPIFIICFVRMHIKKKIKTPPSPAFDAPSSTFTITFATRFLLRSVIVGVVRPFPTATLGSLHIS